MTWARGLVVVALALILGVPFFLRPPVEDDAGSGVPTLIVVTPHVQQIRYEFGRAFERWHKREYGTPARVDWRAPGGTTEILKQLEAQYIAAVENGRYRLGVGGEAEMEPGTIGFDVMLGGGAFDHGRLKSGIVRTVRVPAGAGAGDGAGAGQPVELRVPMSVPAGFPQERLDEWYGPNEIGAQTLYDPGQHWLGTALSSFGIVFNRDVLSRLGLPEPTGFGDLADGRYDGWVALADPRQSGSITTTFDAILNNAGWDEGWRILRQMCGNTRYFTNISTKPPIDVSQGEAAAGLAIDFYGRGQAQFIEAGARRGAAKEGAAASRVGYVDPVGATFIDPDPVSILRGGPNPALARRFVEFCLSVEGQALWQFRARGPDGRDAAAGESSGSGAPGSGEPAGPERYELRRLPARRVMYTEYFDRFVDRVDPFEVASRVPSRGWRPSIGVMMGAFAIDTGPEQRAAWRAILRARRTPGFPPETLAEMERLFLAWPEHELADGTRLEFSEANYRAIAADTKNWRDPVRGARARLAYTAFFRECYAEIVRLGRSAR